MRLVKVKDKKIQLGLENSAKNTSGKVKMTKTKHRVAKNNKNTGVLKQTTPSSTLKNKLAAKTKAKKCEDVQKKMSTKLCQLMKKKGNCDKKLASKYCKKTCGKCNKNEPVTIKSKNSNEINLFD